MTSASDPYTLAIPPPLRSDLLFRANRDFLRDADTYAPRLDDGESIEGLIHPREGLLLYVLARRAAQLGNIVEIGAYMGRSTWYLAQGLRDADSQYKVVSIDPHIDPRQRDAFFETVRRHELEPWVEPCVGYSHDIAQKFNGDPVGVIWLDGDHSYHSVKEDFDDWFPRLSPGGWYAMHDTLNAWRGPTKLARELLAHRADLVDVGVVWLTLFARKTPARMTARIGALKARVGFDVLTLLQARHNGIGPQRAAPGER